VIHHGHAIPADRPPTPAPHAERNRARIAAHRAIKLYPGPVGECVARELHAWDEFGYRFGGAALVLRLIEHIEELWVAQHVAEAQKRGAA
jgi:hypothetical protein